MPITQAVNSKANIKKSTNNDLPYSLQAPVIAPYYAISTANQLVINLPFSIAASGINVNTDIFWLFVDGNKLNLGTGNDYSFTSIGSDGTSSQVTLASPLAAGLNIQAFKLGLKAEAQFGMDNRFVQLYEAVGSGFQAFVNQSSFFLSPVATTPSTGQFYSSISNRANIVDLTQDLKARMGIERVMTQNIYPLQNEFGPNGEQVWAVPNDLFSQIRFVGNWASEIGVENACLKSGTVGDYIEVTFYGTGLNLLSTSSVNPADMRASTDGGSEGSNIYPGNGSGVLNSRQTAENVITTALNGLTLGVHTVKIRNNSTNNVRIYGFEILNESSSVKVQPGVSYYQNQKYITAAQSAFSYSSPVTGTRGGRVLVYQTSAGVIAQAFQAVNTSQANLTSADHTNEEMVRQFSWREFGAGRSDDFSLLNGARNASFTLDDGTTSLTSDGGDAFGVFGSPAYAGALYAGPTQGTIFTFVGCGLDISCATNTPETETYTLSIDGTVITSSFAMTANNNKNYKIVSGLPYGTHTLKMLRNNAGVTNGGIFNFKVYHPKKPSLPSACVELADYNVFPAYAATTTASQISMSTGVLRKSSYREFVYTGSGWSVVQTNTDPNYANVQTGTSGDAVAYTFFGTGIEVVGRCSAANNNQLVQIDGANYTGAATAVGAGSSWTPGTSIWVLPNSGVTAGRLQISGLSLGIHTIKVIKNTGTDFLEINAMDVITPIHSAKSNLAADLQNTLPVGSNAISDNRKTTPVKDILPVQKAWVQAQGVSSGPSTTATNYVPVPDLSATVKTSGGRLKISFCASTANNSNNSLFAIFVDGVQVGTDLYQGTSSAFAHVGGTVEVAAGPGVHKVDICWKVISSTISCNANNRMLTVEEL